MANKCKCPVCGRFISKKQLEERNNAVEQLNKAGYEQNLRLVKENKLLTEEYNKVHARVEALEAELRSVNGALWEERHKSIWQRIFGK